MTMKNIFAGLLAFVTLLSCEQKKDETLVLHSEAGLSLGFTHFKTFTGIVLPQALQKGLPLYIGACVSMLKETAMDFMVEGAQNSPLPEP